MRSIRKTLTVAVAAASVLALAACSSQGGAQAQSDATSQSHVIAMVTHESPGDSFWDKVRAGAEQAAAKLNVDLRYSNHLDGGQQATLVQNAIDSQVDGLAVTLSQADQVGPVVRQAVDAGIPTVAFNAGIEDYPEYGIDMYFGSDETLAGRSAGERIIADRNDGRTLCIVHEQGSVSLEARCAGVRAADPETENLQVNGTDLPSVQQTIGAKLQQDPSITHIVTLGAPVALAAVQAKDETGSQAEVITFDLNADVARAVQDGRISFSVDQQPFVQGYMSVQTLWLNLTNGNDLGGGGPVLTGPSFVDDSNITEIAEYAANNTR